MEIVEIRRAGQAQNYRPFCPPKASVWQCIPPVEALRYLENFLTFCTVSQEICATTSSGVLRPQKDVQPVESALWQFHDVQTFVLRWGEKCQTSALSTEFQHQSRRWEIRPRNDGEIELSAGVEDCQGGDDCAEKEVVQEFKLIIM